MIRADREQQFNVFLDIKARIKFSKQVISVSLISLTLIFRSIAAIFAKQAALTSIGEGLYGILINIWLLGELLALFLQAITWTLVLRRYALSVAYPFMSLFYGINLVSAWLIFHETVLPNHILGIAIIISGVCIMNYKSEQ